MPGSAGHGPHRARLIGGAGGAQPPEHAWAGALPTSCPHGDALVGRALQSPTPPNGQRSASGDAVLQCLEGRPSVLTQTRLLYISTAVLIEGGDMIASSTVVLSPLRISRAVAAPTARSRLLTSRPPVPRQVLATRAHSSIVSLVMLALPFCLQGAPLAMLPPVKQTQAWTRRGEPVLSTLSIDQTWCKVNLYSPFVLHHDGVHRVWYGGHVEGGMFEIFHAHSPRPARVRRVAGSVAVRRPLRLDALHRARARPTADVLLRPRLVERVYQRGGTQAPRRRRDPSAHRPGYPRAEQPREPARGVVTDATLG